MFYAGKTKIAAKTRNIGIVVPNLADPFVFLRSGAR